jgi:FkbM family methyltransferase
MFSTIRFIWSHPIARKERFLAFSRFIRWQIASRVIQRPIVLPFVEGTVLVIERSMTGGTGNFYCGLHEFTDMAFLLHFLRSEELFVDVGANIGSYTVLASGVVGARTIAFEPVPKTFDVLNRNIRVNDMTALARGKRLVMGCESGHLRFSTDRDTVNAVVDDQYPGKSELIPVETLDSLLRAESPILWKVDVEGFESEVLKGAQRSLENEALQAILIEGQTDDVQSRLYSAGFRTASYDPMTRSVSEHGNTANARKPNQLWVRSMEFVAERCSRARQFSVNGIKF